MGSSCSLRSTPESPAGHNSISRLMGMLNCIVSKTGSSDDHKTIVFKAAPIQFLNGGPAPSWGRWMSIPPSPFFLSLVRPNHFQV